jgi:ATP synthase subunit 6
MFFSPLEQFEVVIFKALNFFGLFSLVVSNVTIFLLLAFSLFPVFVYLSLYVTSAGLIPSRWQYFIESFYGFLLGLVKEQLGRDGLKFFPILFLTFVFIATANLLGLVPYAFTTTSHIILTFVLAFTFNLSFMIIGFQTHGMGFLKLFVPSGVKGPLLVLIVIIEVFSYLIRSISLSVRLFANMLAGHTLVHLILTFGLVILKSKYFYFIIAPFVFFVAIFALEFVIALVQAYVFVLLLCIYLNETLHIAH